MNQKTKIALYILIGVLAVVGVVWANIARLNSTVRDIDVQIRYAEADTLITPADVEQYVLQQMPTLKSQLIKEVNPEEVLQTVSKSPYLHHTEVSVSMSRHIVIRTCQRTPVARIFGRKGDYYIDSTCTQMPLSPHSQPDIIMANYSDTASRHNIRSICMVATYLHHHPQYGELFDQIYEESNHDLYLVPRLGQHVVLLGDTTDLDTKFFNLITLYRKGMKKTGWDTYSLVNLKFRGQVVCERKNKK